MKSCPQEMHNIWLMKLSKTIYFGLNLWDCDAYIYWVNIWRKILWVEMTLISGVCSPLSEQQWGQAMRWIFLVREPAHCVVLLWKGDEYVFHFTSPISAICKHQSDQILPHLHYFTKCFHIHGWPSLIGILQVRQCRHCNVNNLPEVTSQLNGGPRVQK